MPACALIEPNYFQGPLANGTLHKVCIFMGLLMSLHGMNPACLVKALLFACLCPLLAQASVTEQTHSSVAKLLARHDGSLFSVLALESSQQDPTQKCLPWKMPGSQRCRYVRENDVLCGDDKGTIHYLYLHYCYLGNWCAQLRSSVG
jgi:hypothetical protein